MKINKLLVVLVTMLAPLLVSCVPESNADTPLPIVTFTVIASGDKTISGLPENRKIEVFTSQTSFNSSLYLYIHPVTEHTVDFSSRRVVLLSLGGRSTGGHSISVEKIEDFGEYIKAKIVIKKPGSNCIVTQSQTSPYEFIEIKRVKELLFEERIEVQGCI
ncbi:MAG: protease complex subunit PrcB family protein [Gammaproteobacteria bacterium]|nr:protease complex subunit PrcB family protein [Gammaproteobacteria bacterium]